MKLRNYYFRLSMLAIVLFPARAIAMSKDIEEAVETIQNTMTNPEDRDKLAMALSKATAVTCNQEKTVLVAFFEDEHSEDKHSIVWQVGAKPIIINNTTLTRSATFSPDGTIIVASASDNTVRIWKRQYGSGSWQSEILPSGESTVV